MRKAVTSVGAAISCIALGFMMELWFPLGDLRWGLVALAGLVPGGIFYGPDIWQWIKGLGRGTEPPVLYGLTLQAAFQNPGGGIHIAKLLQKVSHLEDARELFDIFNDASNRTNVPSAYSAYANALIRFECRLEAEGILTELDNMSFHDIDIADAKDRFFYPPDDG